MTFLLVDDSDNGLICLLGKSVWKALPGWVMLTRRHAQEILALPALAGTDDLVLAWNTVHAPEEVRFAEYIMMVV